MKKFLYSAAFMAAAGLFASSCIEENEPMVVYNPEATVAPALSNPNAETITLSADGADVTLGYTAVDYGLPCAKTYVLYASGDSEFTGKEKVAASFSNDGTLSFKQSAINATILNLGGEAEAEFTVYFKLAAWMANDKNASISSTEALSEVVSVTFIPYDVLLQDKDIYEHIWVQGDYCGWSHDKSQFLYNYNKDGNTFTGVVDFGASAAGGIKFTGDSNWNSSTGNWGAEDSGALEPEAGSVQLINGDASQNISCYSKRFYSFSFDKSSLVLTKNWGADVIGIIGLNGNWDEDIEMEYNADYVRFYADIDVAAATTMKFRADHGWDLNWGVDLAAGGDNIPVEAGQYRVYLDLNKKTVTFSTSMYGQEEPKADVPEQPVTPAEPYKGWGIIGVGGDWENDLAMTETESGVWTGYASLGEDEAFKFRKDAGWDENFSGVFTAVGQPFEAVAEGENITGVPAGFYKMVLDTNEKTITISEGDTWSVIGKVAGTNWDKDFFMTLADGKYVYSELTVADGDEFKLRHNANWDAGNRGGTFAATGEPFAVADGGSNISGVPAGKYNIVYDPEAETVTLVNAAKFWSVIGVNGDWNTDHRMSEVAPGIWISDDLLTVESGDWKIRFGSDWDLNRGAVSEDAVPGRKGEFVAAAQDGKNIPLAGSFKVVYNANNETIGTLGWGLVGTIASIPGFEWNGDIPMNLASDGKWYSIPVALSADDAIKIRMDGAWDDDRGGVCGSADTEFDAAKGGDNIKAPKVGTYMVVYDPATEKITLSTDFWGLIGDFNSWGGDIFMMYDGNGGWAAYNQSLDGGWKIRKTADWTVSVGGTFAAAGEPFEAVSENGANITVTGLDSFSILYNTKDATITVK